MFGFRDETLIDSVVADNALYTNDQIIIRTETMYLNADIDNSLDIDALTDGLLLLRYMFGLRGGSLVSEALSTSADRSTAKEIESYIQVAVPE